MINIIYIGQFKDGAHGIHLIEVYRIIYVKKWDWSPGLTEEKDRLKREAEEQAKRIEEEQRMDNDKEISLVCW